MKKFISSTLAICALFALAMSPAAHAGVVDLVSVAPQTLNTNTDYISQSVDSLNTNFGDYNYDANINATSTNLVNLSATTVGAYQYADFANGVDVSGFTSNYNSGEVDQSANATILNAGTLDFSTSTAAATNAVNMTTTNVNVSQMPVEYYGGKG